MIRIVKIFLHRDLFPINYLNSLLNLYAKFSFYYTHLWNHNEIFHDSDGLPVVQKITGANYFLPSFSFDRSPGVQIKDEETLEWIPPENPAFWLRGCLL